MRQIFLILLLTFAVIKSLQCQEDYSFELSEIEKKPLSLGGSVEFRLAFLNLDKDSTLYYLKFFDRDEGDFLEDYLLNIELNGSFEKGVSTFYFWTNTDLSESYLGSNQKTTLYEGYAAIKTSHFLSLNAGKKTSNWGKGYAWNPVAFIDRQKNTDDPELAREGFVLASADYIKSFDGALKTFSFTPVILPVYENINDDFGKTDSLNFAGKLYFLLYDTDIDLMWLAGESRTERIGADFSRNITSNFEVHGEYAFISDFEKNTIWSEGNLSREIYDAHSYLLGMRYLNKYDTTFIFEYYHDDTGYTEDEMQNLYSLIDSGYDDWIVNEDSSSLRNTSKIVQENFSRQNLMRDYLYLRIIQKEPFNILYFDPSVSLIYNIADNSYSVSPELLYSPTDNLKMRLRMSKLNGDNNTEYGEKVNNYKMEFRIEYFF